MSDIPLYSIDPDFLSRCPLLTSFDQCDPEHETIPEYAEGRQYLRNLASEPEEKQAYKDAEDRINVMKEAIERCNKRMYEQIASRGLNLSKITFSMLPAETPQLLPSQQWPKVPEVVATYPKKDPQPDPWNVAEHKNDVDEFKQLKNLYHIIIVDSMMRNPTRKTIKGSTPASVMKKAVLKFVKGAELRETACSYGISHFTLLRYLKNHNKDEDDFCPDYRKNNRIFNREQGRLLRKYPVTASKMHQGMKKRQARRLAFEFASSIGERVPETWKENKLAGSLLQRTNH
ncbi:hypothetical protein QYM36_002278 [Artemia franciscana]|uniref:Uncharacterized protein n=1 Tax=Artemia franciscana TaxID=6661 RepID=A0AA88LA13_ARTSF|nr:hypothetical protein QYM36_002278 [Artemia franciscana]